MIKLSNIQISIHPNRASPSNRTKTRVHKLTEVHKHVGVFKIEIL